jgi:hypothetical protein
LADANPAVHPPVAGRTPSGPVVTGLLSAITEQFPVAIEQYPDI